MNIIRNFGIEAVIAINRFPDDSDKDLESIKRYCSSLGVDSYVSEVVSKGGNGALELAQGALAAQGNDLLRSQVQLLGQHFVGVLS